ncbi:MAG: choice-of-anchor L domain-containing protein [Bacteroidetes bacterium]|nr:choice-of-anchor L domain-containing protein [Bacteroidota bacterium]
MKKILLSLILMILSESYYSQLSVTPNQTATNLANYLLGGGVTITNAQLTCPTGANAIFTNGSTTNLGLNSGVLLTTGSAAAAAGANTNVLNTNNGTGGIAQMAPITGTSSNLDGCLLEFDIYPQCSPLNIRYKFASDEYPEYVNSGFNDGFGFFISGPNPLGGNYTNFNLATVPGSSSPVTIDNINSGVNSIYYIANGGSTIAYDGMTTVLTGSANVTPCANYHLILAITDGGDALFDSGVFLQQSGISCVGPTVTATSSAGGGGGGVICAGQSATLTASGATTYSWSTGSTSSSIVVSLQQLRPIP